MDGSSTVRVRVRYAETDQMGRAHHAHHLVWCEKGRTAWLRERGPSYADLEDRGVYLPVSRVRIDYKRPVGYDEVVVVETRPTAVRSRSVTFRYRLRRASDGEPVAEAETELVCMDAKQKIRRLPDELRATLEASATEP